MTCSPAYCTGKGAAKSLANLSSGCSVPEARTAERRPVEVEAEAVEVRARQATEGVKHHREKEPLDMPKVLLVGGGERSRVKCSRRRARSTEFTWFGITKFKKIK